MLDGRTFRREGCEPSDFLGCVRGTIGRRYVAGFRAPRFANDWRGEFKVQSSKFGANATREGIPAKTGARRASRTSPKNREHSNNRTSAHYGCTGERHCGAWLGFVWSLIQLWPAGTKGGWSAADRANSTTLVTDLYLIVGTVPKAFCRVPSPCAGRRSRSAELGV